MNILSFMVCTQFFEETSPKCNILTIKMATQRYSWLFFVHFASKSDCLDPSNSTIADAFVHNPHTDGKFRLSTFRKSTSHRARNLSYIENDRFLFICILGKLLKIATDISHARFWPITDHHLL